MLLDAAAVVITEDGPLHVEELERGMAAWGIHHGHPTLITISRSTPVPSAESTIGLWLYGKGGDLIADPQTQIVTSAGLRSFQQLSFNRDEAFGYMSGNWPRLELFRIPPEARTAPAHFLNRLIGCVSSPARVGIVSRVGSHSAEGIGRLAKIFFEEGVLIGYGPVGWGWLSGCLRKAPLVREFHPADVLLFWKPGDEVIAFELPVQERKLRYLTLAWLASHDIRFDLDLRPRYSPSEVGVQLSLEGHNHAEVSGLLSHPAPSMCEVSLSGRGDYLGVNGLMCA